MGASVQRCSVSGELVRARTGLVLKLYHVIHNPTQDLFFDSPELSALMAAFMILFGAIARLALDWGLSIGEMRDMQRVFVVACYIISIVLLIVLLIDLASAMSGSDAPNFIYSFFFVWIGYPVVAIGSFAARSCGDDNAPWFTLSKDVAYALLDTWSKAIFSWWTASRCFGINFLGV